MHYMLADDKTPKSISSKEEIKISDILNMSQSISSDWLKKEAEKKVVIQEMVEEQKEKAKGK